MGFASYLESNATTPAPGHKTVHRRRMKGPVEKRGWVGGRAMLVETRWETSHYITASLLALSLTENTTYYKYSTRTVVSKKIGLYCAVGSDYSTVARGTNLISSPKKQLCRTYRAAQALSTVR